MAQWEKKPELDSQIPHKGGMLTPESYPLTSEHMPQHVCTHTHKNDEYNFFLKKQHYKKLIQLLGNSLSCD